MKTFDPELGRLKALGRYRSLKLPAGLDLSSNDYLGLSEHPALRQAAIEALQGGIEIGASASRLLRGHRQAHAELEAFAADYFDSPRSLFFANGYQANFALVTALVKRDDTIVFDALCHASMRDGIYAVRSASLKIPHNDLDAFEHALKAPRAAGTNVWILVESVYSMDGDMAPVRELLALAEKYDAMLIVDEAHGTGVCGASGRGATEGLSDRGFSHDRLIVLHTCGKALGVAGALVCASEPIYRLFDQHRAAVRLQHGADAAAGRSGAARARTGARGAGAAARACGAESACGQVPAGGFGVKPDRADHYRRR